ncbi:hypothetical protein [Parapedobacter sp. 2B3]|uniref:hypothetical protein n=1 Tax=Parapedobacter sp. 2B3 TaxID=3342381 RepID=UPI0035B5B1C9
MEQKVFTKTSLPIRRGKNHATLRLLRCLRRAKITYNTYGDKVTLGGDFPSNFIITGKDTYYCVLLTPSLLTMHLFCNYSTRILFTKLYQKDLLTKYQLNTVLPFCD